MKIAFQPGILTLAVFGLASAIAPLFLPDSVAAQSAGLQGSYVGVTVDGHRATEGLQTLLEAGSAGAWLESEAWKHTRIWSDPASYTLNSKTDAEALESQIQGRLDLPNTPISARGSMYVSKENQAIMPMLSYDMPVSGNANVYAGAGYTFVKNPGKATPLGDQNGLVLTTGVEAEISKGLVLYGDTKLPLNRNDSNPPVKFQFGAGYRF